MSDTLHIVAASGSSQTVDVSVADVWDITLTANCTLSLTGASVGEADTVALLLRQDGTGGRTVTWPGSVVWPAGAAPTLHSGAGDVTLVTLTTVDGGTTWIGFAEPSDGATGATGAAGADGTDGVGVPVGGTTGQVLAKASATDYDTHWVDDTDTTTMALLFSQVLGSDAASIDTGAGGIAGGYNSLYIVAYVRAADAFSVALRFRFNNDSGANYDFAEIQNNGGSITSAYGAGLTSGILCNIVAASAAANYFSPVRAAVARYAAATAGYKAVNSDGGAMDSGGAGNINMQTCVNQWRNTAAITRMSIFSGGGGNLKAGSALYIYGMP